MGCAVPWEDHHQSGVAEHVCVCVCLLLGDTNLVSLLGKGGTQELALSSGAQPGSPHSHRGVPRAPLSHTVSWVSKWGQEGESPIP